VVGLPLPFPSLASRQRPYIIKSDNMFVASDIVVLVGHLKVELVK
jgi:hypothetical protein